MCTLNSIALELSSNMLEACRTCLRLIDVNNLSYYEIDADNAELSKESCRYKLLSIVPEMQLDITPNSMICAECHGSLEALFEFKAKCLKTEDIIMQYLKAKPEVDVKNFGLKDVLTFNEGVIKDTKDEDVEASIEHVIVKEEENSSDIAVEFVAVDESITIVKHEVDNRSSESVELVHPENKVLESKEELGSGQFKCPICFKCFVVKSRLKTHMVIHTNERPYKCNVCSKGFNDKSSLNYHVQTHNKVKNYKCDYCNKCFTNTKLLKKHLNRHKKPKHCNISNQSFDQIKSDTNKDTKECLYECETCQKKFTRLRNLTQHQKIHGIKNFECKYCNMRFITVYRLNTHLLTHTGEKPHHCDICDKQFRDKQYLNIHMQTHTGERPYECRTCQKNFAYPSNLAEHQRVHLNVREFECEYCKRRFVNKSTLRYHVAMHEQKQSFLCHICKKIFYSELSLNGHIQMMHKDVDINTIVNEQVQKSET